MKCIAYVLLAISAFGQIAPDSGQITGVVKDPDQAVVSGSQVTLTNQQTKAKTTAITDGQGVYKFLSLQPGAYVVEADVKGFNASVSPELQAGCEPDSQLRFRPDAGGATDTVNVTAANGRECLSRGQCGSGGTARNHADT